MKEEIHIILKEHHNSERYIRRGINETARRINQKYSGIELTKDVENFIKNIEICQKNKICRKKSR